MCAASPTGGCRSVSTCRLNTANYTPSRRSCRSISLGKPSAPRQRTAYRAIRCRSLPRVQMPGLRERKKLDKSKRIKAAAKAVFREKGYTQATMREVSDLAGVAAGTLFLYARDKRDLLLS